MTGDRIAPRKRTRVGSRDVARVAGVSQSTVSRALAGDEAISEETRRRVVEAARQLDYPLVRPSSARSVPTRRHRIVGVVVAALHNSFYTYFLERLHQELALAGYSMVLLIEPFDDSDDLSKLKPLLDTAVDGVLFATASLNSKAVQLLHDQGFPLVLAVRSVQSPQMDTVESDNLMAGREAALHLLQLGHRRIGFILGQKNTSTSFNRYEGALQALAQHGVRQAPELCIWGHYSHETGYSGVLRLCSLENPPTAVICGNDVIAIGTFEAAKKHDIEVPGQLSIIGFDDIPMAGWATIQLTTIRQPINEIAALSARRMLERIQSPKDLPARHDVLPTSLIQRGTTAPPRSAPSLSGDSLLLQPSLFRPPASGG